MTRPAKLAAMALGVLVSATGFSACQLCSDCGGSACPNAGGVWSWFDGSFSTCELVAATISQQCDGGLPDGSPWSNVPESTCSTSYSDCLPTLDNALDGPYACVDTVQRVLNSISDAGTCAEAVAVACPLHP